MTIAIAQFRKILPALRLIDADPGKKPADRTIDIYRVDDHLVVTAQDMVTDLEIKALGVDTSNYHTCVNFTKFGKLMMSLKEMPSFDWESGGMGIPDTLVMQSGKRTIKLDSAALERMDYGERKFEPFCDIEHRWDVSRLVEGLEYVLPAISTDETRFHLNGTLLGTDGKMVSTDGHRLHVYDYHLDESPSKFFDFEDTILPRQHVKMLLTAIKACGGSGASVYSQRSYEKMQFVVEGGGLSFTLTCKLIESKFPPYNAVIPKSNAWEDRVVVNTAAFVEASKLLAKMSDKVDNPVEFRLNGQLHLKGGGISESLDATYAGEGFEFGQIGANGEYLVDAANFPLDNFTIEFGGALEPIKFTQCGGFLAVVMPVRV